MTPEQEAQWLQWRREGIGASDVAKIATGSYGGLYSVVADKMGFAADEIDPALAERGHRWEIPIANAVHELTGYYVHGEQMLLAAAGQPLHRATIDGLLSPLAEATFDQCEALLEIKTRGANAKPNWPYYSSQVQWQMYVAGKARAIIAVATIDDTDDTCLGIDIRPIERDEFTISLLIEAADEAWARAQAGDLPEPDETVDIKLVREVNALADNAEPPPPLDGVHDDLARWLQLKLAANEIADELKGIEGRLRHHMGMAVVAEDGRYKLRVGDPVWKFTTDSEADVLEIYPEYGKTVLDRARFKAEEPGLYKDFKRPTTDRRITVKEINR